MKTIAKYIGVLAILLFASLSFAQQTVLQTVHSRVHDIVKRYSLAPVSRMDTSTHLRLAIALPLRNQSELQNLLKQIYNPASPNYRRFLSVAQFTSQFGPNKQDYQSVIAFANANGLRVTGTSPNRMIVDVAGGIRAIQIAFHVTMMYYRNPTRDRTFYAPDRDPSVDLSVPILSINGLSNYSLPHPDSKPFSVAMGQKISPDGGSGPGGYWGYDFRDAYAPGVSLTGSGQSVGLLEFDGYKPADIVGYEKETGLPDVSLTNVFVDGFNGAPQLNSGQTEVSLDIEMAICMAPGLSSVIVYEAGENGNWLDILNRMATDDLAKQLSCSWGSSGSANPSGEQIFEEMAAQGQSFFASSGDNDAYTGLIGFPDDSPNITIVGGTTLTTNGAGGSFSSETVWNTGTGKGSGGGVSTQYAIPTWQMGVSMSDNKGSSTMRNIPDVALTADNVDVYVNNTNESEQGTSCATPLWAGFVALANQQALAEGNNLVGFVNPAVYASAEGSQYSSEFHDVISGANTSSASPDKFYAEPGYDLCSGWGSPNGQALINDLASINTVWRGDVDLTSNYTVGFGRSLTVSPGVTITFTNGAGMIVDGSLNVDGTASQPVTVTSSSGNWAGITFAGSSTGNLQDCTISYASSPVIIDTANVTINGCTINNSSFYGGNSNTAAAIQVWDSNPTIENTAIDGESDSWNGVRFGGGSTGTMTGCTVQNLGAGNGIVIQGGSSPSILSSRITGNYYYGIIANTDGTGDPVIESEYIDSNGIVGGSKHYQGIYFLNSSGHVNLDTVSNSNFGIYCYDYCTASSGQAGENIIIDNNYGIGAFDYSSPVFGHGIGNPPVTYDGTCNQIYNNATDNLYAVNNSFIEAEYNWWGAYPPSGGFYADGTSSLDYTNALTSPGACPTSGSPTVATNTAMTNTAATPVQIGLWYENAGYWKKAAAEYEGILKDTSSMSEKRYALERLYHVFQASKDTTMIGVFQTLADSASPISSMAQEILASAYIGAGRFSDAENLANELIAQHPGTEIA